MQVDPIKPELKAPGTQRLKLQYDKPLLNFAFKFNLRCYSVGECIVALHRIGNASVIKIVNID